MEQIKMENETLEQIDETTNEIMDMIREEFKLNSDGDKDDEVYGFIHTRIKELLGMYKIGELKEEITIPIYFQQKDNGKIIIDIESIRDEFDDKLEQVVANPKKFLEV